MTVVRRFEAPLVWIFRMTRHREKTVEVKGIKGCCWRTKAILKCLYYRSVSGFSVSTNVPWQHLQNASTNHTHLIPNALFLNPRIAHFASECITAELELAGDSGGDKDAALTLGYSDLAFFARKVDAFGFSAERDGDSGSPETSRSCNEVL